MDRPCLGMLPILLICAGVASGQGVNPFPPAPQLVEVAPPTTGTKPIAQDSQTTVVKTDEPASRWVQSPINSGPTLYGRPLVRTSVFSVDAEYLLWFPATSTSSTSVATNDINGPILINSGNGIRSGEGPTSGGRVSFGYWDVDDNPWAPGGIRDFGVEGVFMFVGTRSAQVSNETTPTIFRPFFDLNNRTQSGFLVAFPGLATGGVAAHTQGSLWGAEANVWKNISYDFPGTRWSVNVMGGFRFLDLDERLDINSVSVYEQNLAAFPAFASFAGNTLRVSDKFSTRNQFFGGQIGVSSRYYPAECLIIDMGAKLALGATCENISIAGNQSRTLANGSQTNSNGGLLALPSNSGNHNATRFSQVPELDLKFSSPLTKSLTVSVGFSTIYWTRIARPASQIDRTLDVTQIPNFPVPPGTLPTNLGRPTVPFDQSDLWLLGISVGAEYRW